MAKKLTITVSDEVYEGLHDRIGARRISGFLDGLARPYVTEGSAAALYAEAAKDRVREREATQWDALPADEELPDEGWAQPVRKRRK